MLEYYIHCMSIYSVNRIPVGEIEICRSVWIGSNVYVNFKASYEMALACPKLELY